jgi:hypothetical protein
MISMDKLSTVYINFIYQNNLEEVDAETLLYWGEVDETQKKWLSRFVNVVKRKQNKETQWMNKE